MVVLHLDTPRADRRPDGTGDRESRWTCALVNNMPDTAFVSTEDQFLDLLDIGSGDRGVDVRLYTMGGLTRSEATARHIAGRYTPLDELFDRAPQMLIVTGANPVESELHKEPFWPDMVHVLNWASRNVPSVVLSCLAAHAALTVFDGIERRRLPAKCTGLFAQQVDPGDPLADSLGRSVVLPHSRLNDVPTATIRAAGYDVALCSEEAGWSVASRRVESATVVLLQSHPEYGPTSLLREYQRDVRRYVKHERDEPPVLPRHCTAPPDTPSIEDLHRRLTGGERRPELVEAFPFEAVGARVPWAWRTAAIGLYTHWLAAVAERIP
ncbi:MAG: homoserine O-acetyltransferase/O-succinyltransferase family protein [Acidimicrobiales bacterium]